MGRPRGELIEATARGLECRAGAFAVDPWAPVETALITHAHADHARPGSGRYLCAAPGAALLRRRLGAGAAVEALAYGERRALGEVTVSLHPAGHVLGSAQVRIEGPDAVWVVSGDYKRALDPSCAAFEVVPCDVFVTEATYALPIYRWAPTASVVDDVLAWWDEARSGGKTAVFLCYALGKAQRLLAELALRERVPPERPVWLHGAMEAPVAAYALEGVPLAPTALVRDADPGRTAGELVLAPPSVRGSPWLRRFGPHELAIASGWMRVRGTRRRQGVGRGFALSDHADWPALLRTVEETGASRVLVTHGYRDVLARALRERGVDARALPAPWASEGQEGDPEGAAVLPRDGDHDQAGEDGEPSSPAGTAG